MEDQRRRISYEELEEQANQAASWLRKRGVRAGSTVGLCLERGVELIVSMLGVMGERGAAHLPNGADASGGAAGWMWETRSRRW